MAKKIILKESDASTWSNPCDYIQRIIVNEVGQCPIHGAFNRPVEYEVKPGQSVDVPSEYDSVIHQTDKSGVAYGGLAPRLVRTDPPQTWTVHASQLEPIDERAATIGEQRYQRDKPARDAKWKAMHADCGRVSAEQREMARGNG